MIEQMTATEPLSQVLVLILVGLIGIVSKTKSVYLTHGTMVNNLLNNYDMTSQCQYVQLKACSQIVLSSIPKQTTHAWLECFGRTTLVFVPFSSLPSELFRFGRPDMTSDTLSSPSEPCSAMDVIRPRN